MHNSNNIKSANQQIQDELESISRVGPDVPMTSASERSRTIYKLSEKFGIFPLKHVYDLLYIPLNTIQHLQESTEILFFNYYILMKTDLKKNVEFKILNTLKNQSSNLILLNKSVEFLNEFEKNLNQLSIQFKNEQKEFKNINKENYNSKIQKDKPLFFKNQSNSDIIENKPFNIHDNDKIDEIQIDILSETYDVNHEIESHLLNESSINNFDSKSFRKQYSYVYDSKNSNGKILKKKSIESISSSNNFVQKSKYLPKNQNQTSGSNQNLKNSLKKQVKEKIKNKLSEQTLQDANIKQQKNDTKESKFDSINQAKVSLEEIDSYQSRFNSIFNTKPLKFNKFNTSVFSDRFTTTVDPKNFYVMLSLIEKYPYGALIIDKDLTVIMCNNWLLSKLFQQKIDIIDSNLTSFINLEDREYFITKLITIQDSIKYSLDIGEKIETSLQDANHSSIKFTINFSLINAEINSNEINNSLINEEKDKLILIFTPVKLEYDEEAFLIIDHRGNFYLIWSIIVLTILVQLLWYIPYSLAFQTNDDTLFENIIMVIFIFDILINFNLSIEDEDLEDKIVFNRNTIIWSQLNGWFIFDLVATVPLDLIFVHLLFNTQLFKSIKLIRMIRFIKLLRLTKLHQIQEFLMKSEDVYNFFKKNQGYLDLFKNMMYIQIFAHYYTIIFQQFESTQEGETWLRNEVIDITKEYDIQVYNIIMIEAVRTALGLGVIHYYNNYEIYFQMVWMCIGLSLQGYGIGNISSYLIQANQEDIEQNKAIEYFSELCSLNHLNPKLFSHITSEINNQFKNWQQQELDKFGGMLSKKLLNQIEVEMFKGFAMECRLFGLLGIKALKLIKQNLKVADNNLILRKDAIMDHIYIVKEGMINVQNENMKFINEQKEGEIMGMKCFQSLIKKKDDLDIDQAIQEYNQNHKNVKLRNKSKSDSIKLNKDKIDRSSSITNQKQEFSQIKYNQFALGTHNAKYFMIPFETLDAIIDADMDSFKEIQYYNQIQNELINEEDIDMSNQIEDKFKNNPSSGFIISDEGDFLYFNNEFKHQFGLYHNLINFKIFDVLKQIDTDGQIIEITSIEQVKDGLYQLKIATKMQNIELRFDRSFKLQRNEDDTVEYYQYKKSLKKVGIFLVQNLSNDNNQNY